MRKTKKRSALRTLPAALAVAVLGVWVVVRLALGRPPDAETRSMTPVEYETWAREQFARAHPGEKPLNWAIGRAVMRMHEQRPMGKFVLGITAGTWGNDCSDFVDCAIDEGLGVGARFRRRSNWHLLAHNRRLWQELPWAPGQAVQAGDVVVVRHSPWYEPTDASCSHVGLVGADGMVYDFTKLRRWPEARYGRSEFNWFVRHNPHPGQVVLRRLKAQYRYRIVPLPPGHEQRLRLPSQAPARPPEGNPEGN
jgi:hypothetical protein